MKNRKNMKIKNRVNLDIIDYQILEQLKDNGRKPYRQIAQELHLAVGTITNRVQKLEEQGIIQGFHIQLVYQQLGYKLEIIIKIEHNASLEHIVNAYPKNIITQYKTTGKYNTTLITRFKDTLELKQFLEMLRKGGITSINTELVL